MYVAGATIEIYKTYSARYGKKIARGKNINTTPEDVKKQNAKLAEDNLRRLINHNFCYKDIHLVLTYRKDERPDPQTAKKHLSKFIRDLRKKYQKQGKELKYIVVTEYEGKAIHHHMIINKCKDDIGILADLWQFGRPHTTLLDSSGNYAALASYFIKETNRTFLKEDSPIKKRWSCSRNLERVEPIVEVVKADSWRERPSTKKGYIIETDSIINGVSEVTGYPYQFYRMVKIKRKE